MQTRLYFFPHGMSMYQIILHIQQPHLTYVTSSVAVALPVGQVRCIRPS